MQTLTPIVRRIVANPSATASGWRVASLGYRVINGITGGLWHVPGEVHSAGREIGWLAMLEAQYRWPIAEVVAWRAAVVRRGWTWWQDTGIDVTNTRVDRRVDQAARAISQWWGCTTTGQQLHRLS